MTLDQLRSQFLDFMRSKGHAIVPSSPLVPENDPTTLFTGSGMQPMVPYLLGAKHPNGTKIADSQKCFRSQDIEEVGDNRHTTFFEMLGNWSLGDYFKKEQLSWVFEFLIDKAGLDPNKLYVSVFAGDEKHNIPRDTEAEKLWIKLFESKGINPKGHIHYYPAKENWWSRAGVPSNMPVGEPGGPDSELFYDFGAELKIHENSEFKNEKCHINCDCGRYLEIGNSVFMTYVKTENGFDELTQKNIDFGGGLERILAALENQTDVFQTSAFTSIIDQIEKTSGKKYEDNLLAFRVISDHVRAAVFLAADGVFPSNKEQGYFARRLLRRAIRYGRELGITTNFLEELVGVICALYTNAYPELENQKAKIKNIFAEEEKKFQKAIDRGLRELHKLNTLDENQAFKLYETHGFPLELSIEEAQKIKLEISPQIKSKFEKLRSDHAKQSRTASAGMFKGGLQEHSEFTTAYHTATHLLQAALRLVLGPQVEQKGSNINDKRLRFDFSFERALTDQEKIKIENQINTWIAEKHPVTHETMNKSEAISDGVLAFFADKYPDQATVYSIGTHDHYISRELCGGPHVKTTDQIKPIYIQKEKSAAAGVRRIYIKFKQ